MVYKCNFRKIVKWLLVVLIIVSTYNLKAQNAGNCSINITINRIDTANHLLHLSGNLVKCSNRFVIVYLTDTNNRIIDREATGLDITGTWTVDVSRYLNARKITIIVVNQNTYLDKIIIPPANDSILPPYECKLENSYPK
jgi:hypothetical protein